MKYSVSIIGGAGHIGLPLSCYIQNNGIDVKIIDKNNTSLNKIKSGIPPFLEIGFEEQLSQANLNGLKVSEKIEEISDSNVVILTLGTSSKMKDKKLFESVLDQTMQYINKNSLLILRSTIEAGLLRNIFEKYNLKTKKIKVAYCPERLAEGDAFEELKTLPQIVGVKDEKDFESFNNFFKKIKIETIKVNFQEAEFIKLFLNTYRYANFSLINYFANIASKNSMDFDKVYKIAKKDYPRLSHSPFPGFIGGPCLIKDSKTFAKSYGDEFGLITSLQKSNNIYMENLISKVKTIFTSNKIIQLGLTFKPNSDDLRDSQSLILNKKLIEEGYEVIVIDPYVDDSYIYEKISNFSDNIIISTYHDEFKKYNFKNKKVIVVGYK